MDLKTKNEEDVSEEENDNSLPNSQSNSIPTNYKANVTEATFKAKSVAEEVSEILTNLPETAKKFDSMSSEQNWTSLRLKTKENVDSAECRNISPSDSLCTSDNDDDDEEEAESSDMDEQTSSIHRGQCMDELSLIEKQFFELRDLLHKERHAQIVKKLSEVESETATEYLQQLKVLQQQKEVKLQVAEILKNLRIESLDIRLKAEKLANTQHLNNEKSIARGKIESELDEKIRRLEEDRNNVDTEYWPDLIRTGNLGFDDRGPKGKRSKKREEIQSYSFGSIKRKKKPVTVAGPYIVYMLKDSDILDDWTVIRKAVTVSRRRASIKRLIKKHRSHCRYEDGKLHWGGKQFSKGQYIVIKKLINSETRFDGTIEDLSSTAICIRQNNGKKSKLNVRSLLKGVFSIQHR